MCPFKQPYAKFALIPAKPDGLTFASCSTARLLFSSQMSFPLNTVRAFSLRSSLFSQCLTDRIVINLPTCVGSFRLRSSFLEITYFIEVSCTVLQDSAELLVDGFLPTWVVVPIFPVQEKVDSSINWILSWRFGSWGDFFKVFAAIPPNFWMRFLIGFCDSSAAITGIEKTCSG